MVSRSSMVLVAVCGAVCGLASVSIAQDQPVKPSLPPALSPVAPGAKVPMKGDVPAVPSTGGKIEFDQTTHEFGEISDDKPVEAVFKFTNRGTGPVEIVSTQGSCGCTVPALDKKVYQPGESGEIKVQYNPHHRRGPQHTTVTVTTNDDSNRTVVLNVKSDVNPLVVVEPAMVALGEVAKGRGKTMTVTVTSRSKDIRIEGATPNIALVDSKVLPGVETVVNGRTVWQYPVEISVKPNAPVGPIAGGVSLRTSEAGRQVNFTVQGEVIGDVLANPARLQLGALQPGQAIMSAVSLKSRNGKPFKILKVEEQPQGPSPLFAKLDVRDDQVPAGAAPAYTLNLAGTAPGAGGPAAGTLVLTTDLPDEKEFKITYYGYVRAPVANAPAPKPRTVWDEQPSLLMPGGPR
ncbi:MAG: DUF1573 domain-containing protein [Planctomycetota bacterium]|nr:DUF1573 domain-containing protein [Planctomycetota bacterium]